MTNLMAHVVGDFVLGASDSLAEHRSGRYEARKVLFWGLPQNDIFFGGAGVGDEVYKVANNIFKEYRVPPSPRDVVEMIRRHGTEVSSEFLVAGIEDGRPVIYDASSIALEPTSQCFKGAGADRVNASITDDHESGMAYLHQPQTLAEGFYRTYILARRAWRGHHVDTRLQLFLADKDGRTRSLFHQSVPLSDNEVAAYVRMNTGITSHEHIGGAKNLIDELYRNLLATAKKARIANEIVISLGANPQTQQEDLRRAHKNRIECFDYMGEMLEHWLEGGKGITKAVVSYQDRLRASVPKPLRI